MSVVGDSTGRLYSILHKRPYLRAESHQLHDTVRCIEEAIKTGDGDPEDMLDRLEKQIEVEQESLAQAFKLFDNHGKQALTKSDVKLMNRYLGFPAEDRDIDQIMAAVDTDASGTLSFPEFETYVGRVGGTVKLFEERQKRIRERLGTDVGGADVEAIASMLQLAGIDSEAQAYWKMVTPFEEFVEAARLETCQRNAIRNIRQLAKKNHQEALPKLQSRVHRLGFAEDYLWLTLAWIRELAPIIVHVNLEKMLPFMEADTHYRNQFETQTSGGLLKPDVRIKWERDLFLSCYDGAKSFHRPKYGVQNVMNDYRGVLKCAQYGESYFILKNARLRCTFSPEDSANLKADKLAVLDYYAHVLNEYSDAELKETMGVANSADKAVLGDSSSMGSMKYKEAQIHGEIAWNKHVERLVVHTKLKDAGLGPRIQKMCEKHGFVFSWMDEEQARMKHESMHKLGGAAWKDRLEHLQGECGQIEVPKGFCSKACGRRVAPGVTRAERAFTTCCRGCTMGFGHDRLCGQIDASKVGPGLCKMGCGLKVAPGTDAKQRPLTTCCRGCALGMAHDAACQKASALTMSFKPPSRAGLPVDVGICRIGCGRKVAPGQTASGRAFDTCCRDCARGQGCHSATCIA